MFTMENDGVGIYSGIVEKKDERIWPYLSEQKKHYPLWSEISVRYD